MFRLLDRGSIHRDISDSLRRQGYGCGRVGGDLYRQADGVALPPPVALNPPIGAVVTAIDEADLLEQHRLDDSVLKAGLFRIRTNTSKPLNKPGADAVVTVMNSRTPIPLWSRLPEMVHLKS